MISEARRPCQLYRLHAQLIILYSPDLSTHLSHGLVVMTQGFCMSCKQLSDAAAPSNP